MITAFLAPPSKRQIEDMFNLSYDDLRKAYQSQSSDYPAYIFLIACAHAESRTERGVERKSGEGNTSVVSFSGVFQVGSVYAAEIKKWIAQNRAVYDTTFPPEEKYWDNPAANEKSDGGGFIDGRQMRSTGAYIFHFNMATHLRLGSPGFTADHLLSSFPNGSETAGFLKTALADPVLMKVYTARLIHHFSSWNVPSNKVQDIVYDYKWFFYIAYQVHMNIMKP